ncbi:MAG: hypothetical protein QW161_03215 [Candidatus Bathyarchaeia archaeon]
MKNGRKTILVLGLALLLAAPVLVVLSPRVNADASVEDISSLPVKEGPWNTIWYKFETPLITLIFPAGGKKPMFLWWYTNDTSNIYVVKFQGVIEYLMLDKPYYRHRFHADNTTINEILWNNYIEPRLRQRYYYGYRWRYDMAVSRFLGLLMGLHRAYLPFSACNWTLSGPVFVEGKDYWSFNFTLTKVYGHRGLEFAENNIEIRCRFYNKTVTEIPDEAYEDYNYTVAAGQLKFDFVVKHWEWNIDKINQFLKEYGIDKEIPESRTGLALWINMASIKLEDLPHVGEEVQNQAQNQVETRSRMREAAINSEYCTVDRNETSQDEKPVQATLQLRERFRERIRLHFAVGKTEVPVGFLEFVPWARLLNETGGTVEFVNVTASYVAAGGHLRLFICYPYFGNYTLEHDPTIGLTSAPIIPELINQKLLLVLLGATAVIVLVVAAVKIRKKPINILAVK